MAFPKQLYGRYHFGAKESQSIQAGRFEFNDGTELAPKNATLATLKRDRISQRLIGTFVKDSSGKRPVFGDAEKFQTDPHWRDNVLLTWMHFRLFCGFIVRLPLLLARRCSAPI